MRAFVQRIMFALLTGYIFFYFSEASFWTRLTPSTSLLDIVMTISAYSFTAYVFLAMISAFHVRSLAALFLAGAIYGWLTEGVVSSTLYLDFPLNISSTSLSWHAPFTILIGWHLLPSLLREQRLGRLIMTVLSIGLVYGLWSLSWWVNAPPPAPLPDYAIYTSLTTLVLILAYWLASKVQVARFMPSRTELIVVFLLWLAYYAFITVPAQPLALIILPLLLLLVLFALWHNRKVEMQPDVLIIATQQRNISLPYTCLLFLIPLTAIAVYALALTIHFSFPIGIVFYSVTLILGFIFLIVALIQTLRRKLTFVSLSPVPHSYTTKPIQ